MLTFVELKVMHGVDLSVFQSLTLQSPDDDKKRSFEKGDQANL